MQEKKKEKDKKPPTHKPEPINLDSILHLPNRKLRKMNGKNVPVKVIYKTEGKKALQEWMKRHSLTITELVPLVKGRYQNVWAWLKGIRRPDLQSAVTIQRLTDGYVTCESWLVALSSNPSEKKKNGNK